MLKKYFENHTARRMSFERCWDEQRCTYEPCINVGPASACARQKRKHLWSIYIDYVTDAPGSFSRTPMTITHIRRPAVTPALFIAGAQRVLRSPIINYYNLFWLSNYSDLLNAITNEIAFTCASVSLCSVQ